MLKETYIFSILKKTKCQALLEACWSVNRPWDGAFRLYQLTKNVLPGWLGCVTQLGDKVGQEGALGVTGSVGSYRLGSKTWRQNVG